MVSDNDQCYLQILKMKANIYSKIPGFFRKNMFEIKSNLFYIPYELQSRKQNVLQMKT